MRLAAPSRTARIGLLALAAGSWAASAPAEEGYCRWEAENLAIAEPLCGLDGDAARGRALAADSHGGNCLACHRMPVPEEPSHGTIGPPLDGVGARYTAGQIRLRIVDEQQVNPWTIMPGFYRDPAEANRVAGEFWGKTFLSAQQVEDLVAYLVTLK
jgi:sulfur-oxidizing protein SoxX